VFYSSDLNQKMPQSPHKSNILMRANAAVFAPDLSILTLCGNPFEPTDFFKNSSENARSRHF
jgi:hypothetical protein